MEGVSTKKTMLPFFFTSVGERKNQLSISLGSVFRQLTGSSNDVLLEVFIKNKQDDDSTPLCYQDFQFRGIKSCLNCCLMRPSY